MIKSGRTTGVNRVNSCFSALSLFSSIHFPFLCAPTSIFFAFLSKKVPGKGVAFQIFYIPLHSDTHSAHAELMLSFSKERLLRRGLGRVEVSYIILKCVYYALSS